MPNTNGVTENERSSPIKPVPNTYYSLFIDCNIIKSVTFTRDNASLIVAVLDYSRGLITG